MLEFIKLFWREGLLVALSLVAVTVVVSFYLSNKSLRLDIRERDLTIKDLNATVKLQSDNAIKNKADYEEKLKELPKEITKIQMRYQVIYKDIETITKDKNATCETSIAALDNFTF